MISKPNTRSIAACFTRDPTSAPSPRPPRLAAMRRSTSARYAPVPQHGSSTKTFSAAQPVGDAEIVPERPVHTRHHVAHHLRWRVPDAELLPQVGIEGFEERFVEVRHRLALVEAGKEGGAIHPGRARSRSSPAPRSDRVVAGGPDRRSAETAPVARVRGGARRLRASETERRRDCR